MVTAFSTISRVKSKIAEQILLATRSADGSALTLNDVISDIKLVSQPKQKEVLFTLRGDTAKSANKDGSCLLQKLRGNGLIRDVREDVENAEIMYSLSVCKDAFVKDVLNPNHTDEGLPNLKEKKKVIVEYSSPNIAKPFHFGHLRSTIVGNFTANITEYMKNDVIRINYLGDWGTQFGLLMSGLQMKNTTEADIRHSPIRTLYEAYVYANKQKEIDESVMKKAKNIFEKMELGSDREQEIKQWETYKEYTVKELTRIYNRLGIKFNAYEWESQYSQNRIKPILDMMKTSENIKLEDGRLVYPVLNDVIPLLKSDGTTLYLTRDIAAAIDRYNRYKFDSMLYIVDSTQMKHFQHLTTVLRGLKMEFTDKMRHVRFGRIRNMSTRKGEGVFLDEILDYAKEVVVNKQLKATTTKIPAGGEASDILSISTIVINDLKVPRARDYEFNWDSALKTDGNTGCKLQYVHCRLVSLEENSNTCLPTECDPTVLQEPQVIDLVVEIAKFEEVLETSYQNLQSCILVKYLFELCGAINRAVETLRVKGQDPHISSQRLLLFSKARLVLNTGMKILGLKPLNKM